MADERRPGGAVEPTASELVRAAADGDERAWNLIVERYAGLVWHMSRSTGLGPADAADVAQTVWLRLVESLHRLREPEAIAGWLATTARNECLRVARRSSRELAADDTVLQVLDRRPADERDSPAGRLEASERRNAVLRALDGLGERCRTLLRALAFSPDRSYAEISAALEMPIGSIGPTRSRCLDHLRKGLDVGADDLLGE